MLAGCGERYEIAAVYDPDRARADGFADKWSSEVARSEDEVFDRSEAVFVCTWTSEHRRLVERAAARGRHVFCEKPLAFDATDAAAMVECVERAGLTNAVGLVLRSTPALLGLRELIRDPASGRPMSIVFRDDQFIPIQGMYASSWRGDRSKAGRGTLLEHSIHDLDLLEWLMGPIERIAATQEFFHRLDGIEDSVAVLARFASGASGSLTSIWHDITSRPSQRRIEVFCERALYTLEDEWFGPLHKDTVGSGEGKRQTLEGDGLVRWLAERGVEADWPHGRFLRAIRAGTAATPSFADALRAHELADAAYRSAANDCAPVSLPPPRR
jgi:predicted dehydrogenase